MTLEVLGETAASADPGECAFDDPTLWQDLESRHVVAADDLDSPCAGRRDGRGALWPLITGVGEDAFDEGEQTAGAAIKNQRHAVPILYIGGMDDNVQEEAKRVDKNVPFAALDLLARVIARRIEGGPPF